MTLHAEDENQPALCKKRRSAGRPRKTRPPMTRKKADDAIDSRTGARIKLPKLCDSRGSLSFIESGSHLPFEIKRVYFIYDVPEKASRGDHAHKRVLQIMIAIKGSFDLILDDGQQTVRVLLDQPDFGIFIGNRVWHRMSNFSKGSVCLVLASDVYREDDYIRDYEEFLRTARPILRTGLIPTPGN